MGGFCGTINIICIDISYVKYYNFLMKTIVLSAYRLKQYFVNNKLIFSLYFIGSILCGLMFIYFYGNVVSYMSNALAQDVYYRDYTVTFSQDTAPAIKEAAAAFFDSEEVEDVVLGTELSLEEGKILTIACMYKNRLHRYADKGRIYFTEDEISNHKMVVTLNGADYMKVGEHISLCDRNFEVIGTAFALWGEYCIPYTTFCSLGLEPTFFKVIASERQNLKDDTFFTKLQTLYPEAEITSPTAEQSDKSRATGEIFFVCMVYAICMLLFAFLVKYMVELSAAENVIYMIVGASKAKLLQLLLLDTFFLSAVSGGCSILIHYLCKNSIFAAINQQELLYRASDYFLIFLFMTLISVIMIIPFICVICRKSIISARNTYEL